MDVAVSNPCFQSMFPVDSQCFSPCLRTRELLFFCRRQELELSHWEYRELFVLPTGAGTSSCACGRTGNSREWPQNSRHGKDFIAGSKLLEPPAGSQCLEAVGGPESVAEEPGWPGQPSSRAFPNPFGFGMLPDGFETHWRCSIPIFRSIPTVQDIPVQPEGLGLMRMFQLQVFYPPFS